MIHSTRTPNIQNRLDKPIKTRKPPAHRPVPPETHSRKSLHSSTSPKYLRPCHAQHKLFTEKDTGRAAEPGTAAGGRPAAAAGQGTGVAAGTAGEGRPRA